MTTTEEIDVAAAVRGEVESIVYAPRAALGGTVSTEPGIGPEKKPSLPPSAQPVHERQEPGHVGTHAPTPERHAHRPHRSAPHALGELRDREGVAE